MRIGAESGRLGLQHAGGYVEQWVAVVFGKASGPASIGGGAMAPQPDAWTSRTQARARVSPRSEWSCSYQSQFTRVGNPCCESFRIPSMTSVGYHQHVESLLGG